MLSSIYLTGGSTEPYPNPYADAVTAPYADWRSFAMTKLQHYGLKVINPLEFAWTEFGNSDEPLDILDLKENIDERVQRSLDLIDQCDGLLANLNKPNYGTAMELFYAYRHHKMVTVVGQSPFSPWVLSHSQARFADIEHALEYIIGKQSQSEPLLWALQYESLLAERYEELPKAGEPDYKFIGGEIPALIIAPHATAFFCDGEFQEADAFTGSMAALLGRMSSSHALLTNYCCVADPLSYLETPFCRALADVIKAGQIRFVFILLGAQWNESPGLQIQFKDEKAEEEYANRLKLQLLNIEQASANQFDSRLGTLPQFISDELNVPTLVLKMHKRYRMPRLQPVYFSLIINAITQFMHSISEQLLRSKN